MTHDHLAGRWRALRNSSDEMIADAKPGAVVDRSPDNGNDLLLR
jgi:hypothetical protein